MFIASSQIERIYMLVYSMDHPQKMEEKRGCVGGGWSHTFTSVVYGVR